MENDRIVSEQERIKMIKDALAWVNLTFDELHSKAKNNTFDSSKERLAWMVVHDFLGA